MQSGALASYHLCLPLDVVDYKRDVDLKCVSD